MENTARGRGILGEHGLSYWIDYAGQSVLFDCGQSGALLHNARNLGIDLARTGTIFLSHGHYDHVGGLPDVLQIADQARMVYHPRATEKKFSRSPSGKIRPVNTPFLEEELAARPRPDTITSSQSVELAPGLHTTGEIPRIHQWEDTGGAFYLDAAASVPDPIRDDQSLFFTAEKGLVILLGCAHAGVVNTVEHIIGLTGGTRIHAIIGGMHLLHASPERLHKTFRAFQRWNPDLVAPCHCTGLKAVASFHHQFPKTSREAAAGRSFSFHLS